MGVIIRQSILTSIVSYLGIAVGYVNVMYLYPKFLNPEQIGLVRTISDAAILMTPFATFGLGQSILRFLPQFAHDKKQAGNFFSLIIFFSLISYGIFLVVFLIFKTSIISLFTAKASDFVNYLDLVLWLTFFLLAITLLEQYSRSLLKAAFPAFLREVGLRILQSALVFLYVARFLSFEQFLVATVAIHVVLLIALLLYLLSIGHFRLRFQWKSLSAARIKEVITFSSLSFVGTSSMILVGKMDSVMVAAMLGLSANAFYTTAFYMATVIEIPKRSLTTLASPVIAKAFGKDDINEIATIYQKTSVNQLIVGCLLLIGIVINFDNIFSLMPKGDQYRAGQIVVMIVGIGKLVDMAFGPSSEIIGLSKFYWFNLVVIFLLAITTIVSNYLLIPTFGIAGAAYGSLVALVMYNLIKFFFIYFKLNIQPFTSSTGKVLLISLVALLIGTWMPKIDNIFADAFVRSVVVTVFYGIMIIVWRASEDINKLAALALQTIRNVLKGK